MNATDQPSSDERDQMRPPYLQEHEPSLEESLDDAADRLSGEEDEADGEIPSSGWETLEGNLLAHPRARYWLKVAGFYLICGIACVLWTYHFSSQTQQLDRLERQLKDIRFRSLFISSELIKSTHIDNITQRVTDYQLPLVPATKPPYQLIDSGQFPVPSPEAK